jgi:hypothetical protein
MPAPERKRVFILGAGFSKPAKMPDAAELTNLLLEVELMRADQQFQQWVSSLRERINHLRQLDLPGGGNRISIEQVFEFAAFDIEWCLLRQQDVGETWGTRGRSIKKRLAVMERILFEVLIDAQEEHSLGAAPLADFANALRASDAVLTFNYDTLLERALAARRKKWSSGFDVEPAGDVTVLKLHGSLDWLICHRDNPIGSILFEINAGSIEWYEVDEGQRHHWEKNFVLSRAPNLAAARAAARWDPLLGTNKSPWPGLAGLGLHKPLHRLIGGCVVWRKALRALQEADEIYVIGWSASPYDTMARFHFASVLNLPETRPRRVVVVDPKVCEQIKNYRSIFGEVEPIGQCAQRVDWHSLLGRS